MSSDSHKKWREALSLAEGRAEALLVHNRHNIRYISGYTNDTAVLYISPNRQALLTDFRYVFQAREEARDFEVIDIAKKGYAAVIARLCEEDSVSKLAFEDDELSCKVYSGYREKIGAELIPFGGMLESLRRIKTSHEIDCIAKAEAIGDKAFSEIIKVIKPGMTELSVAARLEYIMKCEGAEGLSFDTIVASGINSSMPHAIPSDKPIEVGDFVTMDFGCRYKGYCSDMTRTVVIGKASLKQRNIYNTVLEAQLAVLDKIRAGVKGSEMDGIARNIINNAGYEGCFGHGLGHSLGLYIHESPACSPKCDEILAEDMLMTVEPGIYVEGFGGVRIEDLVVVGGNSCRNLTFSVKDLIEL